MTLKNLICVFATAILLFSCKKKDDGQSPQNACALSESLIDYIQTVNLIDTTIDTVYSYYHYNSANLLTSVTNQNGKTIQSYTYPDNLTTNLKEDHSPLILNITNGYNLQGQILNSTQYSINNSDTQSKVISHFYYNNAGKIASGLDSQFDVNGGFPALYLYTTTYTWANGNIEKQDFQSSGGHYVSLMEYDSNIPGALLYGNFSYLTNPQNVNLSLLNANFLKKRTDYDVSGHVVDSNVYIPTLDADNKLATVATRGYYYMGNSWNNYETLYIYHYKCK